MHPNIDVRFLRRAPDPSLASSVHRWIARFEAMHFEVAGASIAIESASRGAMSVCLTLSLTNGQSSAAATSHPDPYVAICDAFRAARRELLAH